MVSEIDDLALARTIDGTVRLVDEVLQGLRMPVIAARLPFVAVHALLHHGPFAVVSDEEAVQVKIKTVLDGGAVDLGYQPAGSDQLGAVEPDALGKQAQLVRCLARVLASAAADMDAELALERLQPALQCPDHARGDTGGVPVHAHHRAERLEPEGMGEPPEELVASVMMHDGLGHDRAELRHAHPQPSGNAPRMER